MSKITMVVELGKEELSYLIDYLITDLRAWSEKGFESGEEEKQFQRILNVLCKLREVMGESATLFL
jgi:hypothetical protein